MSNEQRSQTCDPLYDLHFRKDNAIVAIKNYCVFLLVLCCCSGCCRHCCCCYRFCYDCCCVCACARGRVVCFGHDKAPTNEMEIVLMQSHMEPLRRWNFETQHNSHLVTKCVVCFFRPLVLSRFVCDFVCIASNRISREMGKHLLRKLRVCGKCFWLTLARLDSVGRTDETIVLWLHLFSYSWIIKLIKKCLEFFHLTHKNYMTFFLCCWLSGWGTDCSGM